MLDKRQNFTPKTKLDEWRSAQAMCRSCGGAVPVPRNGEYDHIVPTSVGGDNSLKNCKLLCRPCHGRKTKLDRREIAKTKRIMKRMAGIKKTKQKIPSRPMQKTGRKIPSRLFQKRARQ